MLRWIPRRALGLGLCLLLGLALRTAVLVTGADRLRDDPDAYRVLARNLAERGEYSLNRGRPTAFRPPFYPWLLSWGAGGTGTVATWHWLLGAACLIATYLVARSAQLGPGALLATLLVAIDPLLLYQSTLVMTETLAATLVALTLLILMRMADTLRWYWCAASGVVLGLCVLCRPTFLPWLPLVAAATLWLPGAQARRKWDAALLVLLACGLVLAPWALRNRVQLGHWVLTTTHGGYTLWLANNDDYYDFLERRNQPGAARPAWTSERIDAARLALVEQLDFDEVAADQAAYARARDTIRRRPALFVSSCFVRCGEFWNPIPHSVPWRPIPAAVRWAVGVFYLLLYAAAIGGLAKQPRDLLRPPWAWVLALCLVLTAAHTVYWSNLRMRTPLIPVLALLAGRGLDGRRLRTHAQAIANQELTNLDPPQKPPCEGPAPRL